jgi:phosphoglycolate phosphatase-like HAD superfamily hydrolase
MRTKAVIFDVDGTLIDTNGLHSAAWVEAFQHFGVKVDLGDVRRQMGKGGDQLMPSSLPPDLNHVYFEKRSFSSSGSRVSLTQRRSAMTKGSRVRWASKSATRRVRSSALAWQ